MIYHVSERAAFTGDGSKERPFKTIQEAADRAAAGDTVLVYDGIYRERVNPRFSGTEKDPIVYRALNRGRAVISGAELTEGWQEDKAAGAGSDAVIYRLTLDNGVFGSYNPFDTLLYGDWIQMKAPLHTGMLFIDGEAMLEVADKGLLTEDFKDEDTFETREVPGLWHCEQQGGRTVISANFKGLDPSEHVIEATVRRSCFMPEKNGVDNIVLSGFKCTMAATQWAPPTAWQDGAVGPNWAKGWVIEDCEISYSRCSGISLGKYLQPENDNKWTARHVKHGTQTERDAVCQAVNEGWSRERIGSHTVRGCDIHDCGQTGIVGHMGCAFSVIEDNHIHHINNRRDISGAEIGGIKLHAAIDTLIARNHIHHCTRGVWLDWQAQGTRFSANLMHDNMPYGAKVDNPTFGEDIFIEVSHGPTLVDNNIFLSAHAAKIATQGVAFVHNLIAGSFTCVGRGTDNKGVRFPSPRYTPYHVPHSTLIAGFMTINHGDMRFINNIFIQKYPQASGGDSVVAESGTENGSFADERVVGTKPYDGYPTEEEYFGKFGDNEAMTADRDRFYDHLPVTAFGNCYFNGALPYDKETEPWSDTAHEVSLSLRDKPEGLSLETDIFDYLPKGRCGAVNSDILGEAFEPEQRFEAPDGSSIIFDTDYHGSHRGISPVCGPIEVKEGVRSIPLTIRQTRISAARSEAPEEYREAEEEESGELNEERPLVIPANVVLTSCDACTFALAGEQYTVAEVYIRGSEVWLSARDRGGVIHLDCEYGFFKRFDEAEISLKAPFVIDVTEDRNMLGIVNTLATMFRILSKNMVQDPETVCERVRDKANASLSAAGITMRFTPQHLKFIKDKKFITLEEVVDTIAAPAQDVVAEIVV